MGRRGIPSLFVSDGAHISLAEGNADIDDDVNKPVPARLTKHLKKCKDALWTGWTTEYLRALREKHNAGRGGECNLAVGDIVLIKDEQKN